jgi:RNA recognition motif-containing protein
MNVFVGNLHKDVTSDDLNKVFARYGKVKSARVYIDFMTGQSRGFGFVEMKDALEA